MVFCSMQIFTKQLLALTFLYLFSPPPPPSISKYYKLSYYESNGDNENIDIYGPRMGTVTLAGSNNKLSVAGDYEGGSTTIERLIIGSDSVIDFWWEEDPDDPGGMYYPILSVRNLEIVGDSVLILEGYVGFSVKDNGIDISDYFNHIKIREGNELKNTQWTRANGIYYISGSSPWTPVPEPTTYGAIFGALGLGLVTFRRRVRAYRRPFRGMKSHTHSLFRLWASAYGKSARRAALKRASCPE